MTLRTDLDTLQRDLDVTQSTLSQAVAAVYPVGRQVRVKIAASQKQPTWGAVIAHGTGRFSGQVSVRLDTPTKQVRDFHWRMIV
jgi:hypothetical protein